MGVERSPFKKNPYYLRRGNAADLSVNPPLTETISTDTQSVSSDTADMSSQTTEHSVSSADLQTLKDEMISRVEALFASHLSQVNIEPRNPSAASELAALSSVLREPPRPEINFQSFWKSSPALWFTILEEQFAKKNIVSDSDKYFNSMRNLDEDLIRIVSVAVTSAPPDARYTKLKETVISKFSHSKSESFKNILGNVNMGARSSSEFLEFWIASSGNFLNRDAVLLIWRETLPSNISVFLGHDINNANETQNIQKADYIYNSIKRDSSRVNSFGIESIESSRSRDDASRLDHLEKKLDLVLNYVESRRQAGSRSDRRRGSNDHHGEKRGRLCRNHYKFKKSARGCSSPNRCKKLETVVEKETSTSGSSVHLHIKDLNSSLIFMTDSGAEVSVIPWPCNWVARPVNFVITATSQLPIKVYGVNELNIEFVCGKPIKWQFVVVDVWCKHLARFSVRVLFPSSMMSS
ncbi:hypothetical protein TKK_0001643 [Trichogramma kaykai]